jgi:hypothetical protein
VKGDLFEANLSPASVITMFLLHAINLQLRPTLLTLRPGTRIVSNTFSMADWKADETKTIEAADCSTYCTALLWIVPARVEGTWRLARGSLTFKQEFQMVTGSLEADGRQTSLTTGRLRGHQISFSIGQVQYTGRVNGDTMRGTVTVNGKSQTWRATRVVG